MTKKTILIVDDHPLVREGLKSTLKPAVEYEVVGQAGNAREAARIVKNLKPDLALLDLALPDKSGIDLCREIRNISPSTRIMIVIMHSKVDYIVRAFQVGATGYMAKQSATDRPMQGIESVLSGEYFMDSSVSHSVVKKLMQTEEKDMKITDANFPSFHYSMGYLTRPPLWGEVKARSSGSGFITYEPFPGIQDNFP